MKALTAQDCQKLDQLMKERLSLSEETLMEAVVSQCAFYLSRASQKRKISEVILLCGPGNNGGDGLALARHLHGQGLKCQIFAPQETEKTSALNRLQRERIVQMGLRIHSFAEFIEAHPRAFKESILIDALFGVGLSRPLEGLYKEVVEHFNLCQGFRVSLDCPSGLDVNRGTSSCVVKAHQTLTVGVLKPGFFTADGPTACGKVKLIHGGFQEDLITEVNESYEVITPKDLAEWLPQKRSKRSHKGSLGKCHLVVGSSRYLGAARLAATAALASGAGFIQVYGDKNLRMILKDLPQLIFKESLSVAELNEKDAVLIGSGVTEDLSELLRQLKEVGHKRVVLDAGVFQSLDFQVPNEWVLTPHPGELARLLKTSIEEVEKDRFTAVKKAQDQYGGQILLKGFLPILRTYEKKWWCLPFGDERLGKAGSGDTLGGVIVGLLVQMEEEESAQATALAVYLCARASELVTQGRSKYSLLVSELPQWLGAARLELN